MRLYQVTNRPKKRKGSRWTRNVKARNARRARKLAVKDRPSDAVDEETYAVQLADGLPNKDGEGVQP